MAKKPAKRKGNAIADDIKVNQKEEKQKIESDSEEEASIYIYSFE